MVATIGCMTRCLYIPDDKVWVTRCVALLGARLDPHNVEGNIRRYMPQQGAALGPVETSEDG